jgi:hypothetical protein
MPVSGPRRFPVLSWPVLRWGAAVACLVVVGAAVLLRHEYSSKQPLEVALKADSQDKVAGSTVAGSKESAQKNQTRVEGAPRLDQLASAAPSPTGKDQAANLPAAAMGIPSRARQEPAAANIGNSIGDIGQAVAGNVRDERAQSATQSVDQTNQVVASRQTQPAETRAEVAGKAASVEEQYAAKVQADVPAAPAPPPAAEVALSKSKADANESVSHARRATGGVAALVSTMKVEADAANEKKADLSPRWTLSEDGSLQRSLDAGKTWETLKVPAEGVSLRAIASFGTDVWIGGASGALYHSSDGGEHWVQVRPVAGGKALTDDILRIEFQNVRQGRLTTSTQETWSTADRGQTWERK